MAMLIKKNSDNKKQLLSEINVTPFVDVMLVLLVVFMVTSPMLISGVHVDLPKTSSAPISGDNEPLAVTIDKKGNIFINNTQISLIDLSAKLKAITKENFDTKIFVRGDKDANYGDIMSVIAHINDSGFSKVALITTNKNLK